MTAPRAGRPGPLDLEATLEFLRVSANRAVVTVDGWYQNNVAASQVAVTLDRAAQLAAAVGFSTTKYVVDRKGSIVAVHVKSNEARTAGTLTVTVYANGTSTKLSAALDGSNTVFAQTVYQEGVLPVSPGDELQVKLDTSGTWAPTTGDIVIGVRLVLNS